MPIVTNDLHRLQTENFIEQNPTYLVLHRRTMVVDGAGGMRPTTDVPLNAQRVRVVHQTHVKPRVTPDGREVLVDKSVVGLDGFDVELGDLFTYNDKQYEVINIHDLPGWRTVAEAIHHG